MERKKTKIHLYGWISLAMTVFCWPFSTMQVDMFMGVKNLEVHTEVEVEAAIVRGVERVVADIAQADVVWQVGIEQVVAHAAADAQTAVETLEGGVRERV